jgi:cytochrome c peroxidase
MKASMNGRARAALVAALIVAGAASAAASEGPAEKPLPAPAAAPLYDPPAPGTYDLPAIMRVGDHRLLGVDGRPAETLGLAPGRAAVVAFIYRSCTDSGGCPYSLSVLQRLDAALARRPDLARRVRLVTVSFDPDHDTPARMKELRALLAPKGDWRFFTAGSRKALAPVLDDFGQDAVPVVSEYGRETGKIEHVLKVFLVDERGDVRNIYSTGLLDERLLLNDLLTVFGR